MGFNSAYTNSFIIVFFVFVLLIADLIGTSMNIASIKNSSDSKNSTDSSEITSLTKNLNTKLKYTVVVITLVLIYYIVNAAIFAFAQNIK